MTTDSGAGEGAGAGGGTAAIDPLTGEAAGGAAAAAGTGGAAAAAGGESGAPAWWNDLSGDAPDDKTLSDRAWIENKKYADLPTLIKAARGLESQIGGEKLPVPKGPDDKEGYERIFKALGRPEAADGYTFDGFKKVDPQLTGAFAPVAHGLGLSQSQLEGVVKFNEEMLATQEAATRTAHANEVKAMRTAMGGEFEAATERSLRAAERFGLERPQLDAIRNAIGPKALITMLDGIGKAMGEDVLLGGGKRDLTMTADRAQARLDEIKADPAQRQKVQSGDPAAKAEWETLNAAIAAAEERQRAA